MARGRGRPPAGSAPVVDDEVLLDMALAAFADLGYEAASVRDLCRKLGVSHNLIHQRFGSKDLLWHAAVDQGFAKLVAALADAVQEAADDDLARLRAVLVRFVEVTATSPALLRVLNQEATTAGPRLDYLYERYVGPANELAASVLRRLEAAGRVRHLDAAPFHFLLANGAAGPLVYPALASHFGRVVDTSRPAAVRRYAESVVDLLLDGMQAGLDG
ncbi:MAG: TetR/AcrR family transcriptional regulator [Acidimicrobiales bacterium]